MNPTQVLLLFLKENKQGHLFTKLMGHINYHFRDNSLFQTQKKLNYDPVKNMLCSMSNSRLYDVGYDIYLLLYRTRYDANTNTYIHVCNDFGLNITQTYNLFKLKWGKFIREKIDGNYYKLFIPCTAAEFDRFKSRNGYHDIDFSLKPKIWGE